VVPASCGNLGQNNLAVKNRKTPSQIFHITLGRPLLILIPDIGVKRNPKLSVSANGPPRE
jgi:hypothetical protein